MLGQVAGVLGRVIEALGRTTGVSRRTADASRRMVCAAKSKVGEDVAQATVEMAVVAPLLIVLALIVYNLMLFMSATARFERVVPDIVIAQAVSPAGDSESGTVAASLSEVQRSVQEAMDGYNLEIEVSCEGEDTSGSGMLTLVGTTRTYLCRMKYKPWPTGINIAGVSMGAPSFLQHERRVVIDPWRPGVVA